MSNNHSSSPFCGVGRRQPSAAWLSTELRHLQVVGNLLKFDRGCGEAGQGHAATSIADAIAATAGQRLRDLPLTRERIKTAIGI